MEGPRSASPAIAKISPPMYLIVSITQSASTSTGVKSAERYLHTGLTGAMMAHLCRIKTSNLTMPSRGGENLQNKGVKMIPALLMLAVMSLAAYLLHRSIKAGRYIDKNWAGVVSSFRRYGYRVTYNGYSGYIYISFNGSTKKGYRDESSGISKGSFYSLLKKLEKETDGVKARGMINELIGLEDSPTNIVYPPEDWSIGGKAK